MSCGGCQPDTSDTLGGARYANCVGQTIVDPTPGPVLRQYAGRVGAPLSGRSAWIGCLVAASLITHRLIYFKQNPGDCGQKTAINIGVSGSIGAGLGLAAGVDPEPISKAVLTGVAAAFGVFTAAHTAAVAREQATLCDVANAYNQNAFALEQLVQQGAMTPAQAASTLHDVVQQLHPYLDSITKTGNAAYGYGFAIDALVLYNAEVVYPALYQAPATGVNAGVAAPGSPGVLVPGQGSTFVGGGTFTSGTPVPAPGLTGAVDQILSGAPGAPGSVNPWVLIAGAGLVVVALVS